jgi:F0F1-type ATP synthase assembly protein I
VGFRAIGGARVVKLAILALVLIVGGAIVGLTTDYNPVLLIVAGFVCGFIAAFREIERMPMRLAAEDGPASSGAAADAQALANQRISQASHGIGITDIGGAP